ncbi:hypothetical protein ACWO25_004538 [Vibrio parahaemolyticus]
MSSKDGIAAYIPPREECVAWRNGNNWRECARTEITPSKIVKDQYCQHNNRDGRNQPDYCSHTIRYVTTYIDGQPYGDTHYFDTSGNTYTVGSTTR